MRYEDYDLLPSMKIIVDSYVLATTTGIVPVTHVPHYWARGLEILEFLGLINMPHFGRLVEANTCAKKLLACFHGGYLWLERPVPVTNVLI